MIIAVDFDGTLHTGRWPETGSPAPYAREVMRRLKEEGHYLIIWTSRAGDELIAAINWLLENHIPFDRVNDNPPGQTALYGNNSRKVYAHLYVDDKQVGGLPTWPEIYDCITRMELEYNSKTDKKARSL
jgi:hypothetical protein